MAKRNYKFRLPKGKVLQFTPTGKAVPLSAQTIADDQLLVGRHVSNDPVLRGLMLAQIKGGGEAVEKYLREQFPEDYPPSAS